MPWKHGRAAAAPHKGWAHAPPATSHTGCDAPESEPSDEPAAAQQCPGFSAGGTDGVPEVRLGGTRDQRCSERYSSLLRCGAMAYLFSRVEVGGRSLHEDRWVTLVRAGVPATADAGLLSSLGEPREAMPARFNMSHNGAFLCLGDGRVAAYGGRRKAHYFKHPYREPGILRSVATPDAAGWLQWSQPTLVASGSASLSGCVEQRVGQVDGAERVCEFDGKLSAVAFRGRTLLYARANTLGCGGRAVQVSSSADGLTGWSRWQLLEFDGLAGRLGTDASVNIYFFNAHTTADGGRLVATFPASLGSGGSVPGSVPGPGPESGGSGGVYASSSTDGVRWSAPRLLLSAKVYSAWRITSWPVDGELLWPSLAVAVPRASLLVEHGVRLEHGAALSACAAPPFTCRYDVDLRALFSTDPAPSAAAELPRRQRAESEDAAPEAEPLRFFAGGAAAASSEAPGAAPPPRLCGASHKPRAHVLLLRGAAFRWGCSAAAQTRQAGAYRSHLAQLIAPIEAAGGCVRVLLSSSSACGAAADGAAAALFAGRVVAHETRSGSESQADAVAAALRLYRSHALATDETLFFSRHDVTLRAPLGSWACAAAAAAAPRRDGDATRAPLPLGVASRCEAAAWESYRCVNDLLFVVPRERAPAFFASVGSAEGSSRNPSGQCGCFAPRQSVLRCPGGNRQSSGHDCYNVLAAVGGLRPSELDECWPAPRAAIGEPGGAFYELPQCEEVDEDAAYRGRSCRRSGKLARGAEGVGRAGGGGGVKVKEGQG